MRRFALAFAALLSVFGAVGAHAQRQLILIASGINCTDTTLSGVNEGVGVNTFTWGAATAFSGNNGSRLLAPGKLSLSVFSVTRPSDACSSSYLAQNLKAAVLPTVTLTEYVTNAAGKPTAELTITLTHAVLSSYTLGGDTADPPRETLSFAFESITVTNNETGTTSTYRGTVL